jgi:Family of unknown function (DUF6345)
MATQVSPTLTPPAGTNSPSEANAAVQGMNPAAADGTRGGDKLYGFCSIETFCNQGGLSLTHDDAQGFYNYVNQFNRPNFWYQDAGVKPWIYYEQFDNWQDTYGADAVKVFYHSGHGGMGGDGTFFVPMGADWGGLGCTATSNNMRLGNEYLRYLFWSTCLSLRYTGGMSPIRTWDVANLGLRMIFGFETVSYDNANYGRFFWEEWNKNKSFSQAWLDSSWRIAHNQGPTVVACGATQAEVQDRLFNERFFSAQAASKNWWWWRWYSAAMQREAVTSMPERVQRAELAAAHLSAQALFDRFEMGAALAADGSANFADGARSLWRGADGNFAVRLGQANLDNTVTPSAAMVRGAAERLVERLALRGDAQLVLDRVIVAGAAGGSSQGSGDMAAARTTETIVQYRQLIDGVPVISPGAGTLRVAIDNDGNATRVESSLRAVRALSAKGVRMPPQQPEPEARRGVSHADEPAPEAMAPHEAALAAAVGAKMRSIVGKSKGAGPVGFATVPGSTEVGYDISGDSAHLIATRSIEVDFGSGYKKLYRVDVPLFG